MSNLILPSNVKRWYDIVVRDDAGNIEPIPDDAVFTAVSNDPTKLAAEVGISPGSGAMAVALHALVDEAPASAGLTITVDDAANLRAFTRGVEISDVTPATQVDIDDTSFFDEPQPEPAPAP